MKKILVLASAVSAIALTAGANADDYTLYFQATVPPVISITSLAGATCTTGTCTPTFNGNGQSINLTNFTNAQGFTNDIVGSTTLTLAANSNFTAQVYSDMGGIRNTYGYQNVADYTISVTTPLGGSSALASVSNGGNPVKQAGLAGPSIPVTIGWTIVADTNHVNPLPSGSYSDTLHVSFVPGA